MVYVTHDQVEAMTMGDRIVVLKDGHVQQIAPPLTLYDRPANRFVAGFIGSPAMNFIEGTVESAAGGHVLVGEGVRLALPDRQEWDLAAYVGRPVTLGIRPEDISVGTEAAGGEDLNAVDFQLDVVEPMGHEVVLYASLGSYNIVARIAPQPLPEPGQVVTLVFDPARYHLFDGETGLSLKLEETALAA
jgi:multiple sugar transport system ATP-binding protein